MYTFCRFRKVVTPLLEIQVSVMTQNNFNHQNLFAQNANSFWSRGTYTYVVPKGMSIVILRRIGRQYRNGRYRTISGIFLPKNESKISACASLTFSSWTARKWVPSTCRFVNVLSLNFLWMTETLQQSSRSDFVVCIEMSAWVSAVSEGGW
jgi:hypothetical protein